MGKEIKQPMPNISSFVSALKTQEKKEGEYKPKVPKVGVLEAPSVSMTPLADTIEIQRQENPQVKVIPAKKVNKVVNFEKFIDIFLIGAGAISLIKLIKKK